MLGKKYVVGVSHGWTRVKSEPDGMEFSLPEYTRVEHTQTKSLPRNEVRDVFTVLEGAYRGKVASVIQTNGRSNLKTPLPAYTAGARLKFDARKARLSYGGREIPAVTASGNEATPNGTHFIRLPDAPHGAGQPYLSLCPRALTWFYIGPGAVSTVGTNNAFYLHPGRVSAGCVTVTDLAAWTGLYNYLATSRQGDGLSVGTIEVINSPR
jgi:hypothetical protein